MKILILTLILVSCNQAKPVSNEIIAEKSKFKLIEKKQDSVYTDLQHFNPYSIKKVISTSKQIDSSSSVLQNFNPQVLEKWNLSHQEILQILKSSKFISGTEWDLSYEVLPYCYKGTVPPSAGLPSSTTLAQTCRASHLWRRVSVRQIIKDATPHGHRYANTQITMRQSCTRNFTILCSYSKAQLKMTQN